MLKRILVGSTIAATGWAAFYAASRWYADWGADPAEAERELLGDDLVADAARVDTRGITIAAPPSAVWPWLVQMGYGRAGWYSYDRLDMRGRSADEIHPEWQELAIGDVLPTDSLGGFVVRALDPERALVVFIDSDLVAEQRGDSSRGDSSRGDSSRGMTVTEAPGLAASGQLMGAALPPRFAASWAFALEPLGTDQTRLVERVRIGIEAGSRGAVPAGPLLGFGVFVMMQRQMLGIRDRAERLAGGTPSPAAGGEPVRRASVSASAEPAPS
jgi:hypothetical protein